MKTLCPTIDFVEQYDPEIGALMQQELRRQRRNIELIASENIASPAVIACMEVEGFLATVGRSRI